MTKQVSENIFTGVVAALVIKFLTPAWNYWADQLSKAIGPALMTVVSFVIAILIVAFCNRDIHYSGILGAGAEPETSPERQAYEALRKSLAGDNLAARLYTYWLERFLDAVDRFFGDGDAGTQGQRAFGLEKPAPLWTARAFDRCLLLAFIYPIATILVIWAVSGHVGPAEAALGLKPDFCGWERGLSAGAIGLLGFAFWRAKRMQFVVWLAVFAGVALALAIVFAVVVYGAASSAVGVFVGFGVVATVRVGVELTGAVAFSFTIFFAIFLIFMIEPFIYFLVWSANTGLVYSAHLAFAATVNAVVGGVILLSFIFVFAGVLPVMFGDAVKKAHAFAIKKRREGVFLSFFLPAAIVACLAVPYSLSGLKSWELAGPLLLFLGLLTLFNTPFDWASLGLTRALLRLGLELKGWWPYFLALADALLAAGIVVALALVMVIGVQAFDELAAHGGGKPVLPLDTLLDGIAKNPAAPEYWWAYALLLSSMIPSFINLAIGGMSLLRGIPGVPSFIRRYMPADKAALPRDRAWIALLLTGQNLVGACLGVALQGLLAWGLIFHLMPAIGLDLLDMARAVAAFDFPARIGHLFAGVLALT